MNGVFSRLVSGVIPLGDAHVAMDDCVEAWHAGEAGVSLWEYMGMTRAEYDEWVRDPKALVRLVEARRRQ